MAISNGYATQQNVKDFLRIDSTDTTDDAVIDDLVEKASRQIDNHTGRTFYARTETRSFDTPAALTLYVDDDLLTISTLTNGDGVTVSSSDYILWPANATPYYAIELISTSGLAWQTNATTDSRQAITVAGTWGYTATTPENIGLACLLLVADTYKKRFGKGASSGFSTSAGVRILPAKFPARVETLLAPYVRTGVL